MLKLQGSNKLCIAKAKSKHLEFKGVPLNLKRSQIYNRIKRGRLGISVSRNRTDDCPVCDHWRQKVVRPLSARMDEMRLELSASCKNFWDGFIAPIAEFPWESPLYMSSVMDHIDKHCSGQCCEATDTAMLCKLSYWTMGNQS